jgi:amidase
LFADRRSFACATAVLNKVHQAYLARIEEVNLKGPTLHAVLETNPHALAQAAASDLERKVKGNHNLGLLHGIPILVKDNIATSHEDGRARFHRH